MVRGEQGYMSSENCKYCGLSVGHKQSCPIYKQAEGIDKELEERARTEYGLYEQQMAEVNENIRKFDREASAVESQLEKLDSGNIHAAEVSNLRRNLETLKDIITNTAGCVGELGKITSVLGKMAFKDLRGWVDEKIHGREQSGEEASENHAGTVEWIDKEDSPADTSLTKSRTGFPDGPTSVEEGATDIFAELQERIDEIAEVLQKYTDEIPDLEEVEFKNQILPATRHWLVNARRVMKLIRGMMQAYESGELQ